MTLGQGQEMTLTFNTHLSQGQPRVTIYIDFKGLSPRCCMLSFKIIGLLVLEKKVFNGLHHTWAWRPYRSCDLEHLYKLWFPLPKEVPHKIWPVCVCGGGGGGYRDIVMKLHVWILHGKIADTYFWFSLNYLPL